jgi:signal transduction histidine kinase
MRRNLAFQMLGGAVVLALLSVGVFVITVTAIENQRDATRQAQTALSTAPGAAERQQAADALEQADSEGKRAERWGVAGMVLIVLGSVLIVFYLIRGVLIPVKRIEEAASRIADGDLSARVPRLSEATGIDRMGEAFNSMAAAVEKSSLGMVEAERGRDEFFSVVSHELRTPLTSIIGYLELLLEDDSLPAEQRRKFLNVINRNARRLLRLVGDLLFVARVEAGRVELDHQAFDLAPVIQGCVETFQIRAASQGLELVEESTPLEGRCVGDEGRIAQAVDNLISNAIKFSPEGGRVTVRLHPDGPQRAAIEVADTGMGIPESDQEALFSRFFRGKLVRSASIQGTGLGLGIVKTIVDGHGGEISLESVDGEGSTFTIKLPLVEE